jgi:hypothetical protein
VHAGGQHLQQAGVGGGQPAGKRVQAGLVHRHQLREAAVHVAAEQRPVAAQLRPVPAAQVAVAAERGRVDQHPAARRDQPTGARLHHRARHLMPQHPGGVHGDLPGGDLDVGAAQARLRHPDQGVPVHHRPGDLPHGHDARLLDQGGTHDAMLPLALPPAPGSRRRAPPPAPGSHPRLAPARRVLTR